MKCYYQKTNGNNIVIITDGITAKVFNASPTGILEGIDLYADDALERLREKYSRLAEAGELPEYAEIYSGNEIDFDDVELENAELFYND